MSTSNSASSKFTATVLEQVALLCPVCRVRSTSTSVALLQRFSEHSWRCSEGHHFDRAKQGYLNLLPAQLKRSKDPGDSKAMVQSRRRFLEAGYYQPIAEQLSALTTELAPNAARILDAGCGEGYYLRALQTRLDTHQTEQPQLLGNDVSKWAVQAAAPWHKQGHYVVASNARLPYLDASLDVIVCAFGFVSAAEFRRVLAPGGVLITLNPLAEHLLELRQLLYPHTVQKANSCEELTGFHHQQTHDLSFDFELEQATLQDLIAMTPHAYRASNEGKARARAVEHIVLQAAVRFNSWQAQKE